MAAKFQMFQIFARLTMFNSASALNLKKYTYEVIFSPSKTPFKHYHKLNADTH